MDSERALLTFEDVAIPAGPDGDAGLSALNLQVPEAGLVLIRAERRQAPIGIADAAEGLLPPQRGCVRFLGRDWAARKPRDAVAARARIRRVFSGPAWVSNLDVDENVTLRERHHTGRPAEEIEAEAVRLARAFGLADLPRQRPAWTNRADLARAQWVRALLGAPRLLLLEFPEHDAAEEPLAAFCAAVRRSREGGAGTVWFTSAPRIWDDASLRPTGRFELRGSALATVEEKRG